MIPDVIDYFNLYRRERDRLSPAEQKRFDIAIQGRRPSQIAENYRKSGIWVSEQEYRAALNEAVEEAKETGRDLAWFAKSKPEPRGMQSPLATLQPGRPERAAAGEGTLVRGQMRKQNKKGAK